MDRQSELDEIIEKSKRHLRLLWWMNMLALLTMIAGFLAPVFLMIRAM